MDYSRVFFIVVATLLSLTTYCQQDWSLRCVHSGITNDNHGYYDIVIEALHCDLSLVRDYEEDPVVIYYNEIRSVLQKPMCEEWMRLDNRMYLVFRENDLIIDQGLCGFRTRVKYSNFGNSPMSNIITLNEIDYDESNNECFSIIP
jgi:hypothetical protein